MTEPHQDLRKRLAKELGIEKTPDEAASLLESHRELFEAMEGRELSVEEVIELAIAVGRDDEKPRA
jgi:hypothetical protein